MKGWKVLSGDINWIEFGCSWYKKDGEGRNWVLNFYNKEEGGYECDVRLIDLKEISHVVLEVALISSGMGIPEPTDDDFDEVLVNALNSTGTFAPMGFHKNAYPDRARAEARREAESMMADEALIEERLSTVMNRLGSTARDFANGDPLAGLRRKDPEEYGPEDKMVLKMYAASDGETLGGVREAGLASKGRKL